MTLKEIKIAIKKCNTTKQYIKKLGAKRIGWGAYRNVYEIPNSRWVMKIEHSPEEGMFCNVVEYLTYQKHKLYKTPLSKWLAPSVLINETGNILIQRKVKHDKDWKNYPKKIPACLSDRKITNYGWIGKKFVACDYGSLIAYKNFSMENSKWWDLK